MADFSATQATAFAMWPHIGHTLGQVHQERQPAARVCAEAGCAEASFGTESRLARQGKGRLVMSTFHCLKILLEVFAIVRQYKKNIFIW